METKRGRAKGHQLDQESHPLPARWSRRIEGGGGYSRGFGKRARKKNSPGDN